MGRLVILLRTQFTFDFSHTYNDRENGIAVPVTLLVGGEKIGIPAIVDTGSTFCIFQRRFGEALGLDLESGIRQEFRTAAGNFIAYGHEVTLSTLGIAVDSIVYFFADEAIRKNVLGRRGWLDRVRLAVVDYEQVLYLAPYDSPSQ